MKWFKGIVGSILGFASVASVTCLPCWIPFLYLLNSLGLIGLLDPVYAPYLAALPALLTAGVVYYTTRQKIWTAQTVLIAIAMALTHSSVAHLCMLGILGMWLWTAKDMSCRIPRR